MFLCPSCSEIFRRKFNNSTTPVWNLIATMGRDYDSDLNKFTPAYRILPSLDIDLVRMLKIRLIGD